MKAQAIERQRAILAALCGYRYISINELGADLAETGLLGEWLSADASVRNAQRRMVARDISAIDKALAGWGGECWLDHQLTTPAHGGKPVRAWRIRAHAGLPVMDDHGRITDLCEQHTLAALGSLVSCVGGGPLAQVVRRVMADRYGDPSTVLAAIAACGRGHGVPARHVERLLKVCWRNDYQSRRHDRDGYRRIMILDHGDGRETVLLPLRLLIAADGWRIVGWLPRLDGIRAVPLAGLADVRKGDPPRELPNHQVCYEQADQCVAAGFAGTCGEDAITSMTLSLSHELWQREQGRHWGDQLQCSPAPNGVILRLCSSAPMALAAWVAGQAGAAQIMAPVSLRDEVTRRLRAALTAIRSIE